MDADKRMRNRLAMHHWCSEIAAGMLHTAELLELVFIGVGIAEESGG
jgi:hypothetical protein